jgi:hypothetical protein
MTALFADTFYWIALGDFSDSAHQRALALTAERPGTPIVATDEALAEHLTFWGRHRSPGCQARCRAASIRRRAPSSGFRDYRHVIKEICAA